MSSQFHIMKKDGTGLCSVGNLGSAMDLMGSGQVMFMGTAKDAVTISKALSRLQQESKWQARGIEPGTLLAIAMEEKSNDND